jgi:hypothetical protein
VLVDSLMVSVGWSSLSSTPIQGEIQDELSSSSDAEIARSTPMSVIRERERDPFVKCDEARLKITDSL